MKNKIFKYSLLILLLATAFLAWRSVDRAINVPESSNWWVPFSFFSLWFILFCLVAVVVTKKYLVEIAILGSLLLNFVFVFRFSHALIILAAFLCFTIALMRIKGDIKLNIRIELWKTLRTGSGWITLGLALAISSQYYWEIKSADVGKAVINFEVQGLSSAVVAKVLKMANPDLENVEKGNLTVDQLILQLRSQENKENNSSEPLTALVDQVMDKQLDGKMSPAAKETAKEETKRQLSETNQQILEQGEQAILAEGRNKLSEIVGTSLTGQEKVSDVAALAVNKKINDYFTPRVDKQGGGTFLPLIMALVIFLSILPLGPFWGSVLILISELVFFIFRQTGLVVVHKVPAEIEVIE